MKLMTRCLWLLLLPVAVATSVNPTGSWAKSRTMLSGWGPFRFGMTVPEAVAAAQAVAGENAKLVPAGFITYDVTVDEQPFRVSAYFSGIVPRLSNIQLEPLGVNGDDSLQSCLSVKSSLASKLSSTYGTPDSDDTRPAQNRNNDLTAATVFGFEDGARIVAQVVYSDYPWSPSKHLCVATIVYSEHHATTPTGHL